jgi:hypothetical protein
MFTTSVRNLGFGVANWAAVLFLFNQLVLKGPYIEQQVKSPSNSRLLVIFIWRFSPSPPLAYHLFTQKRKILFAANHTKLAIIDNAFVDTKAVKFLGTGPKQVGNHAKQDSFAHSFKECFVRVWNIIVW